MLACNATVIAEESCPNSALPDHSEAALTANIKEDFYVSHGQVRQTCTESGQQSRRSPLTRS